MAPPAPQDARWISTFLDAQAAELGVAQNTQLAYGRDLSDAAAWLARTGQMFETAERADIEAYLSHLDAQGLAASTRARRLSSLKQLFRFAYDEGWRKTNPALQITGPKRTRALPKTLSIDDVDRLLCAAETHGKGETARLRNTCLMQILYATGLRVTELVSLPVAAVRGEPALLLVRGKGGKERMVPLSPPARAAIRAWLVHRDALEETARIEKGTKPAPSSFPQEARAGI